MNTSQAWLKKPKTELELLELLPDKMWRLHNLYYIINENAKKVLFRPRPPQLDFLLNRHGTDVILKARQLGFSTVVQIDMLDDCLFKANNSGAIIAQSIVDCQEIFRTKIKTAYDNLNPVIKERIRAVSDSKVMLELSNGSVIRVGTSLRSSTNNNLHVSEYGKICVKYPEKAKEIRTGALNTVHTGQKITIESTAEGQGGDFFNLCETSQNKKAKGQELSEMDFKFHFYPWFENKKYRTNPKGIVITQEKEEYFRKLEVELNITLDDEQRAWYVKKEETQFDQMKREFPSTPKEAFEQAIEGAYFKSQMLLAREDGRVGFVPFDPKIPVNTFWDIGISKSDYGAIWFHQRVGLENRFIHYYENSGEHLPHYAKYLQDMDCVYGSHYFPHDANHKDFRKPGNVITDAYELLKGEIVPVPRIARKQEAVQAVREILGSCSFDEKGCSLGIKRLDNYRKEWNEHMGIWRDVPRHDDASHGTDAFMQFAQQYRAEESNSTYAEVEYHEDDIVEEVDDTGY